MNNNQKRTAALRHKLMKSSEKQAIAIKNTIIGTSSFLLMTPIYISNIDDQNFPLAILSFLEIGTIYLPIQGIKNIIKIKKEMKLTRKQIEQQNQINNLDNITTAYILIKKDLDKKILIETKKKEKEKLKHFRKKLDKIYS